MVHLIGMLPISKSAPDEVSLTSYYSKIFVIRSQRKRHNYSAWIVNTIIAESLTDDSSANITDVKLNNVFNQNINLPRSYSAVSQRINKFKSDSITWFFDVSKIKDNFDIDWSPGDMVPVGKMGNKVLSMDYDDNIHIVEKGVLKESLGHFASVIGLDTKKMPIDFIETRLFGKAMPLGIILGYQLGLGNLIATLKGKRPKRLRTREKYELGENEWELRFKDYKLIIDKSDKETSAILRGFIRADKVLRRHSIYDFDKRINYNAIMEALKIPPRYLKEIPLMFDLWVDPITEEVLTEMKEPTNLVHLYIRAVDMLMDDTYHDPTDVAFMRDRGYERHAGIMYGEIVKEIRRYNSKPISPKNKIDIHPEVVWSAVTRDSSNDAVREINPIHELKEQEVVVYRGEGGRNSRSMMARDRTFHKNSLGSTSEATVDNGDTGTIVYTSFNPNYTSVRGLTKPAETDPKNIEPAKLVSTSMLLSPGAENDDAKRVGFTSIQNSSSMHAKGYTCLPVRTGAERVIGGRTSPTYNATAKQDCTVTKINKKAITVEYKDGTSESFPLGRVFGAYVNKQMPHNLVTEHKVGDKVKTGQTVSYNENFFEPDPINKNHTNFKMATLGRVAMIEGADGYEDSSAMSTAFTNKLTSDVGHLRDIVVTKEQDVKMHAKVGDLVEPDTILCTIHNAQSASNIFDDEAIRSLEKLSQLNPKAKYKGRIERIETRYVPDIDALSETLQEVVSEADRELYRERAALGQPRVSGQVEPGYQVGRNKLTTDSVLIRIFITEDLGMGVGDKLVVGNQLKATVGRVWSEDNERVFSEADNQSVDVFFSYQSVDNRIVNSPEIIGTTSTLLVKLGELAVDAYFGKS